MTLRDLDPGDYFTIANVTRTYERGAILGGGIAIVCRILGRPRDTEVFAPTQLVVLVSRIADRRQPTPDAGADVDPLTATQEHP